MALVTVRMKFRIIMGMMTMAISRINRISIWVMIVRTLWILKSQRKILVTGQIIQMPIRK